LTRSLASDGEAAIPRRINNKGKPVTIDRNTMFYGGLIVFACAVGMALSAPTFLIYSFGVFIDPLTEDLGVGRGAVSLALSIGILFNLIAGPAIGVLSDRYGARRMVLIGVVALSLILMGYSLVQTVYHLYIASALLVLLGAGTGPITYSRVIAAWFNRRRGLALGIALVGIGIGGAVAPVLSQAFIGAYGWRMAYVFMGVLVFVISFPVLYFILRNEPENGRPVDMKGDADADNAGREQGLSTAETIRTKEFWILAIGFLIIAAGNSGGLVHLPPLLTDAGLTPERAALYAGLMGVGVTVGRAFGGFLLDLFHAPYVAICFLAGPFIAYTFFLSGVDPDWAFLPVLLFGIGMGAEFDVIPFLATRYFGIKNFGVIYGINISTFSIGTGLGPAIMGFGYDKYGNYQVSIMIAMSLLVAGSLLISRLGAYRFR
jgi:MFS family permease